MRRQSAGIRPDPAGILFARPGFGIRLPGHDMNALAAACRAFRRRRLNRPRIIAGSRRRR